MDMAFLELSANCRENVIREEKCPHDVDFGRGEGRKKKEFYGFVENMH